MNKVILMGRLTRDPEVRYSAGDNSTAVARYTLAVNRRFKRDNEPTADFIPCVAFGKAAEFAEKWFRQGMQVAISGRIQTGSYTNKEGTVREAVGDNKSLYEYLLEYVTTEGATFHWMKQKGIPCERTYFYEVRRYFYYLMAKRI